MSGYGVCLDNCNSVSESGDFYDAVESRLMRMIYWAHRELLFEKIKQRIEKEEGQKLDKLADLIVEASKNRWEAGKEADKRQEELKKRFVEALEE